MQRGETACAQCGLVVSESEVDTGPEWRVFDKEERERAAPLKLVVKTDIEARPEHGERWRRLAKLNKRALHRREWKLAAVGAELRRVKECAGVPQAVAEEAELLLKRYLDVLARIPPEAAAVALLWVAAKAAGAPRPLEDFLVCSRAEERRVRRAVWRLVEAAGPGRRLSIEDYVKVLAARAGVPASVVKRAVEILEKKRRLLAGKNPWVWAAAALWLASLESSVVFFASMLADAAGVSLQSLVTAAERLRT
mgnify:CR=1 FL=1